MYKYEYVWLDGYSPEPNLRSKTKILKRAELLEDLPIWSFDGSSTQQAEGSKSDCYLKPVKLVADPERSQGKTNAWIVLCEVLNPDGTPHETNIRSKITDDLSHWWGFEQEYVLYKNGLPLGFDPENQEPQGRYYCGVGNKQVTGRDIVEEHLNICGYAGLEITGINAEVLIGQWEFQVFGKGVDAADQLWIARYLLERTAEKYGVDINYRPKPLIGDWNGSGLHTNFSTSGMRHGGDWSLFENIFKVFEERKDEHIKDYGSDNHLRLTGKHETQSIDKFSYGVADRGASIRIPKSTMDDKKGYLEDRRPAANADPYKIIEVIQESFRVGNID
jgi:glutamine synthetase